MTNSFAFQLNRLCSTLFPNSQDEGITLNFQKGFICNKFQIKNVAISDDGYRFNERGDKSYLQSLLLFFLGIKPIKKRDHYIIMKV